MRLLLHQLDQGAKVGRLAELGLGQKPAEPKRHGPLKIGVARQAVAAQGLEHHATAGLELGWQLLPMDAAIRGTLELLNHPALQGGQLPLGPGRQTHVEAAGCSRRLDQKDQQPAMAGNQANRLQRRLRALGPGDQAEQPGQVSEATGEVEQQVIQGGPLKANG